MSDLKATYEAAEAKAQKLMAERDEAVRKVRAKYAPLLHDANQAAREAQQAWMNAEAAAALVGRDDAERVAGELGLELPDA